MGREVLTGLGSSCGWIRKVADDLDPKTFTHTHTAAISPKLISLAPRALQGMMRSLQDI